VLQGLLENPAAMFDTGGEKIPQIITMRSEPCENPILDG